MARPKPTKAEIKERKQLSGEFKEFAKKYKFTEIRLAEVIGISRRSVQMIRAGLVTPHDDTVKKFQTLKKKYEKERAA